MTTTPIYRPNLPTGTTPGAAAEFRQIGEVSRRLNAASEALEARVAAAEANIVSNDGDIAALSAGKVDRAGDTLTGDVTIQKAYPILAVTATSGNAAIEVGAEAGSVAFIDLKTPASDDYDLRISSYGATSTIATAASINLSYSSGSGVHDFGNQRLLAGSYYFTESGNNTGFYSVSDGSIGVITNGTWRWSWNADGTAVTNKPLMFVDGKGIYSSVNHPNSGSNYVCTAVTADPTYSGLDIYAIHVPGTWAGWRLQVSGNYWDFRDDGHINWVSGRIDRADGNIWMPWAGDWLSAAVYWSDTRLKSNIRPATADAAGGFDGVDFIEFDWSAEDPTKPKGHVNVGVSAQQLQALDPTLVKTAEDGTLYVDPQAFTMRLAFALKQTRGVLRDTREDLAKTRTALVNLTALMVQKDLITKQERAALVA